MKSWGIPKVHGIVLFDDIQCLGIGELFRYKIVVDKKQLEEDAICVSELFVRVKNKESPLLRPVYLTGPYACYVDVRPFGYDENEKFDEHEKIQFTSDLRPDEHFKAKLLLNKNSKMEDGRYSWTIDVVSQVSVSPLPTVEYEIKIGTTKAATKHLKNTTRTIKGIVVEQWDTTSLWNFPPKFPHKPVHLVILTHGIFSNIGCDMLYMKDKIEQMTFPMDEEINPNVIIRGCMDNMGKSARGIRYLGTRVARYVIATLDELNEKYKVDKISFIGHSLGGPVQAMALHYIAVKRPEIFDPKTGIKPINFITLASPFIGVVGDFPRYVSLALDVGALGLTGRDLTLKYTPLTSRDGLVPDTNHSPVPKLILEAIPHSPALEILQRLVHRTLYANVLHDGIVPLRTAALLYLDWSSLAKIREIRKKKSNALSNESVTASELPKSPTPPPPSVEASKKEDGRDNVSTTGEIPVENMDKRAAMQWIIPQGFNKGKKYSKYTRTQTMDMDSDSSESDNGNYLKTQNTEEQKFAPPPEASTILAAISVITSSIPTQEYIRDPSVRTDAIIHDKLYDPSELPAPHYTGRSFIKKVIYPNETINRDQERIARAWQETMTWRKVLVDLKPDSHNNICVRRRFTNLFGNVAVSNMVKTHFGPEACQKYATL